MRGAKRAITMTLAQANSDGSEVGYVNAHATSTPIKGDEIETGVIDRALPAERHNSDDRLLVSSDQIIF
jgi:3-oxoacyl-(acyl-carrier-protein) synthase